MARKIVSSLLLPLSAVALIGLFVAFADLGALFGSNPLDPMVAEVGASMAARAQAHNERNERTVRLAEATIAEFCDGQPVTVKEVFEDGTASVAFASREMTVAIGVYRKVEDPTYVPPHWPKAGDTWQVEATVLGPAITKPASQQMLAEADY